MTTPIEAPARPPRPRTVTVAFWLQLAAVVVLLGLLALVVVQAVQWNGRIDEAARAVPDADPGEVAGERWSNTIGAVVMGLPILLLAVWFAATAQPVRRGGRVARILVFVAAGAQVFVCFGQVCAGAFFVPLLFAGGMEEPYPPDDGPYPDGEGVPWVESPFFDALYGSPDPFGQVLLPLAGLGALTVFLLTAAVVLLLALPPAHRWFVPAEPAHPTPPAAALRYAAPSYAAPSYVPPSYVPPSHVAPGYAVPGYVPPGYLVVPPGYALCPDPSAHAPVQADVPGSPPDGG